MPNLHLTWSAKNNCFVKSLGAWINEAGTDRVPRFFRFFHPNTPEGLRAAQAELLPLVAQWQAIKAEAKRRGEKYPVWYREKLARIQPPNFMQTSTISKPTEDDDVAQIETSRRAEIKRLEKLKQAAALAANLAANPVKPLEKSSIKDAKERYCDWYRTTGVKGRTATGVQAQLDSALKGIDETQPMVHLNALAIVDEIIGKVSRKELRGRSAHNYARAIKAFVEWFLKQTKAFDLPDDWKEKFVRRRFRDPADMDAIFSEDAEESDFEIFTNADLKEILAACKTPRQSLYVLLALNAAMYYVDIAYALKTKNVYLDRPRPFLLYKREKESHHPNPIIQKVWLWPETVKLLRRELNSSPDYPFALLSENGTPMTEDSVESTWKRVKTAIESSGVLKHRRTIRFTDLRKTGGTVVSNLSSVDLGNLHLGHKVEGIGARYIKLQKKRLYRPLMKWRDQIKGGLAHAIYPDDDSKRS